MAEKQYWWCLSHERVEEDHDCPGSDRLGPYPSREAAQNWKDRAEARNDAWDAEDRKWRGDD